MDLYLDVDGVIVGCNYAGDKAIIPNIEDILVYTKKHFRCYWLTTHGRYSTEDVIKYLKLYSPNISQPLFDHIEASRWNTLKTEAIDFTRAFIWIDDQPLQSEIQVLKEKDCIRNWLFVDTCQNINNLTVGKIEEKRKELFLHNKSPK